MENRIKHLDDKVEDETWTQYIVRRFEDQGVDRFKYDIYGEILNVNENEKQKLFELPIEGRHFDLSFGEEYFFEKSEPYEPQSNTHIRPAKTRTFMSLYDGKNESEVRITINPDDTIEYNESELGDFFKQFPSISQLNDYSQLQEMINTIVNRVAEYITQLPDIRR